MSQEQYKPAPLSQDLQQTLDQRAHGKGFHATIRERSIPSIGYTDYIGSIDGLPTPYWEEQEYDKALIKLDETISAHQLWARRLLGEAETPLAAMGEFAEAIGLRKEDKFDLAQAVISVIPLEELTAEVMEEEDSGTEYRPERNPIITFDKLRSLVDGRIQEDELTPRHLFEAIVDIYTVHDRIYQMDPENGSLPEVVLETMNYFTSLYRFSSVESEFAALEVMDKYLVPTQALEMTRINDGEIQVLRFRRGSSESDPMTPQEIRGLASLLLEGYISTPPQEIQRTF